MVCLSGLITGAWGVTPPRVEGLANISDLMPPPSVTPDALLTQSGDLHLIRQHLDYGSPPAEELTAEARPANGSLASGCHACEQSVQRHWRINGAASGAGSTDHSVQLDEWERPTSLIHIGIKSLARFR